MSEFLAMFGEVVLTIYLVAMIFGVVYTFSFDEKEE